jgi:hypothetical protein
MAAGQGIKDRGFATPMKSEDADFHKKRLLSKIISAQRRY